MVGNGPVGSLLWLIENSNFGLVEFIYVQIVTNVELIYCTTNNSLVPRTIHWCLELNLVWELWRDCEWDSYSEVKWLPRKSREICLSLQ